MFALNSSPYEKKLDVFGYRNRGRNLTLILGGRLASLSCLGLGRRLMEASPDFKTEQKQRESEAEDGQADHQVGSRNRKELPVNAVNRKTVFVSHLLILVAIQTYMPCRPH